MYPTLLVRDLRVSLKGRALIDGVGLANAAPPIVAGLIVAVVAAPRLKVRR
jgi:hypothetical protein